jgi:hypothetical protein
MTPPVYEALKQVVTLMADGRFEAIEDIDQGGRMSAVDWKRRVREYGRTIVTPPEDDYVSADVVPIVTSDVPAWSVWYRLWTREEGKSDLAIELTVRYPGGDKVAIDVDDLRVG